MTENSETPVVNDPNEIDESALQAEANHYGQCGALLKEERTKQGLSVGDICTQLRLSATQIEALEADEFSKLPQPSIVRGFIRNYAKALQIDATPILAAYQQLNPETAPQPLSVKKSENAPVIGEVKSGFSPLIFTALLGLFVLIGGGYYYYTNIHKQSGETIAVEDSSTDSNQATTELVLEQNPEISNTFIAEPVVMPTDNTDTATSSIIDNNQQGDTATTALTLDTTTASVDENADTANDSSEAEAMTNETPAGHAQLNIATVASTWVNITDINTSKTIFSEIIPANSNKTINVKKPFKAIIGNAPETNLTIDGETFDLTAKTRNRVAKFKVQ